MDEAWRSRGRVEEEKSSQESKIQNEGGEERGADTLTDWLRSPPIHAIAYSQISKGSWSAQSVLDNFFMPRSRSLIPLLIFHQISLKLSRSEKTRDEETETVGPSIHGNPCQVHWFICNSGNISYNEKLARRVAGIQARLYSGCPRDLPCCPRDPSLPIMLCLSGRYDLSKAVLIEGCV